MIEKYTHGNNIIELDGETKEDRQRQLREILKNMGWKLEDFIQQEKSDYKN